MKLSGPGAAAEAELKRTLPAEVFREKEPRYLEEPHNRFKGHAGLVLAPSTVDEVSTIIRFASENRVPVIPYGGGTGLVGGQITADYTDPIVLSLSRFHTLRAVYPSEIVIFAVAGAILAAVQSAA